MKGPKKIPLLTGRQKSRTCFMFWNVKPIFEYRRNCLYKPGAIILTAAMNVLLLDKT